MSPEHKAKVDECLDLLQEAQALVNSAGKALCSVPGFAEEWDGLTEPYECVKKHWYKVASRYRIEAKKE